MFSLLGRLVVSLVILMGFSVLTAWAWDRSDKAARAQAPLQQEALVSTSVQPATTQTR